ncbi:MAG: hypothetical protein ACAI44_40155 [Candidatus Sericytochromatia bacterium]
MCKAAMILAGGLLVLSACRAPVPSGPVSAATPAAAGRPAPQVTLLPATPSAGVSPSPSPTPSILPRPVASCVASREVSYLSSSPVWSPDGRWLLYLRQRHSLLRQGGSLCENSVTQRDAYHLLDLHSGYSHALWPDASYVQARQIRPVWSPDASQAALLARFGKDRWRVFVLTPATLRLQPLDVSPPGPQQPLWGPDSQSLFLPGIEADSRLNLLRWHPASEQLTSLGIFTLAREQEPWNRWLPHAGRLLALEARAQGGQTRLSLTLQAAGQPPQTLWEQVFPGQARGESLAVSPDERQAAFWLRLPAESGTDSVQLRLLDLASGSVSQIFTGSDALPLMDWSKDSRQLAFSGQTRPGEAYEIYAWAPERLRQLTHSDAAVRNQDPAWAPDAGSLIFASSRGSPSGLQPAEALWQLELKGEGLRQLTCANASHDELDSGDGEDWLLQSGPAERCP